MSNYKVTKLNLNRFFKEIHLKKQYFKKMQNKLHLLTQLKESNKKKISLEFFKRLADNKSESMVIYIVYISFLKKNTLLHVSDSVGNLKFFYSTGFLKKNGKRKISRALVLRHFYRVLVSKFKFLKKVPVAVHFKNADSNMFWFLKKLKNFFFVLVTKHFYLYPYNGCRKKKSNEENLKINF